MNSWQKPYTFDRVVRIIITVLVVCGIFYLLKALDGALLPFVVAWLIAYLLNPLVLFFQNRCRIRNRLISIIVTLTLVLTLIIGFGALLLPNIVSEINKTADAVSMLSHGAGDTQITNKVWYQDLMSRFNIDDYFESFKSEEISKLIEDGIEYLWIFLTTSIIHVMKVIGWGIVLLYLIFILLDYDKIIEGFKRLIPNKYRPMALTIMQDVEEGMNRYFRGQALIALIVGILFSIGFVIIGLPMAIPLGLFIGFLNLVPYLQIVGVLPTLILCYLDSYNGNHAFWTIFGLSMVVFAVVQIIQDVYITPKIMGKVTGLNPAVILLSLSIWGALMGVMGLIIALPMTTLLLSYYRQYILGEVKDKEAENQEEDIL